eukprot:5632446-Pleurochrysis_carterae.AAC.1
MAEEWLAAPVRHLPFVPCRLHAFVRERVHVSGCVAGAFVGVGGHAGGVHGRQELALHGVGQPGEQRDEAHAHWRRRDLCRRRRRGHAATGGATRAPFQSSVHT